MSVKKHQIRLSGDPYFQDCLRRALSNLCRLQHSANGHFTDVASIAVHVIPAEDIIAKYQSGCCPPSAPHAKSPAPQTIEISGAAAEALTRLRGEVVSLGEPKLNLRGILHNAICVLADRDDAALCTEIAASKAPTGLTSTKV